MKKMLVLLAAIAALNCSAQSETLGEQELKIYIDSNRSLVESGQMKLSDYSKGIFSRIAALGASRSTLNRVNVRIRDAELLEAGKIDRAEFDFRSRAADAIEQQERQAEDLAYEKQREETESRIRLLQQQDATARQQGASNTLAVAAQLLQAGGPRLMAPPPNAPVSSMAGFLKSQSISGFLRYCAYSNGIVTTINSIDLCPLQTQ
jgi:hypothetical protein